MTDELEKVGSPDRSQVTFEIIGTVRSPFKDRFGIPRQPGLVPDAGGFVQLKKDFNIIQSLNGLETFSHLWILFVFHERKSKEWIVSIRPPRLGGRKKVGSLASRSPHRPNPIGMSAVKILKIEKDHKDGPRIYVDGLDLLDGTPVVDLKPYLTYCDSIPDANNGWAEGEIPRYPVEYSDESLKDLATRIPIDRREWLKNLITQMVGLDPRPTNQKRQISPEEVVETRTYGFRIDDWDIHYSVTKGQFLILRIMSFSESFKVKETLNQDS